MNRLGQKKSWSWVTVGIAMILLVGAIYLINVTQGAPGKTTAVYGKTLAEALDRGGRHVDLILAQAEAGKGVLVFYLPAIHGDRSLTRMGVEYLQRTLRGWKMAYKGGAYSTGSKQHLYYELLPDDGDQATPLPLLYGEIKEPLIEAVWVSDLQGKEQQARVITVPKQPGLDGEKRIWYIAWGQLGGDTLEIKGMAVDGRVLLAETVNIQPGAAGLTAQSARLDPAREQVDHKAPKNDQADRATANSALIGETFSVKGRVGISANPAPYSVVRPEIIVQPGEQVMVENIQGKFAQVEFKDSVGWIPTWYLTKGKAEIRSVPPQEMIIKTPTEFYLFPDEAEASGFPLEPGKVVHLIREYQDWYSVDLRTYDQPYVGDKWIKKAALIPYDSELAKEGYVADTVLSGMPATSVRINGEVDGMYQVNAAGGLTAMIRKEDFHPNPYELYRQSRTKYLSREFGKAQRIELINLLGNPAGVIEGSRVAEFAELVAKTVPGPYPEGYTGGEIAGGLVLHYPDGKVNLTLASGYLGLTEPEIKQTYGMWYENESYLLFGEGISVAIIKGLFADNLQDLAMMGRMLSEEEMTLTLDGEEIKYSNRLVYRDYRHDLYFNARELGEILGIKVVEALDREAGEGLEIAPAGSVATFHQGLMSWQRQDNVYVYTTIANSDAGLEPSQVCPEPVILDDKYYISSRAIPYLFYTRIDLEDDGSGGARVSLSSFQAETRRAQAIAREKGFKFTQDGTFRFDKYIMQGKYIVHQNTQAYVLDRDGQVVFGPWDGEISHAYFGGYLVQSRETGLRGLYADNGSLLLPSEYSSIQCVDLSQGVFLLAKGAGQSRNFSAAVIAGSEIKMLLPDEYDEVMTVSEMDDALPPWYQLYFGKYISVKQDGKWGAYDLNGNLTVPLEYEAFGQFVTTRNTSYFNLTFDREQEYITVKRNGKWGVISMQNEIIVPFEYDLIFSNRDDAPPDQWYGQKGGVNTKLN